MDARATAKYVKAVGTIAYAQPEILALPQETLDAIMEMCIRDRRCPDRMERV